MAKIHVSYNQIHTALKDAVERYQLNERFQPDLLIAIGGGGFIPARILRTFLKRHNNRNIPIQAVGLSLYEELDQWNKTRQQAGLEGGTPSEPQVTKTQWLNFDSVDTVTNLLGRHILIVDEVDDTRKTLAYAVQELTKDLQDARRKHPDPDSLGETKIGIFVLHNKEKPKRMQLPEEVMANYYAAVTMPDQWLVYPWDALDIEAHTEIANQQAKEHGQ